MLKKVDEYLWYKHGDVTQWADKKFGWDKYDLATICRNGYLFGALMNSTYYGIQALTPETKIESPLLNTVVTLVLGLGANYYFKKELDKRREEDFNDQKKGIAKSPKFGYFRPTVFGFGIYAVERTMVNYLGGEIGEELDQLVADFAMNLIILAQASHNYFLDQPTPPASKEESLLGKLTNKMRESLTVPQPIKVESHYILPTQ